MNDGYEWQPKINAPVWLIDRDLTATKRWVDGYSDDRKTVYLRTIQSAKKINRGMKAYPANGIGNFIHTSYQEARLCIKMHAVKFPGEEAEYGKDGNDTSH